MRFVAGDFNSERVAKPMSFWLVLDRGNHRLCAMSLRGQLLFEIGRALPPAVENRWVVPGLFLESELEQTGLLKDFPALDFTYYPERILGDSENALYVWEPSSRTLKQVLLGNLLPVRVSAETPLDWVSADEWGLIGWDRRRLLFYGWDGELRQTLETSGVPVPTSNSGGEFWLRCGERMERWTGSGVHPMRPEPRLLDIRTPLRRTAQAELRRIDSDAPGVSIREWADLVDHALGAGGRSAEPGT